VNDLALSFRRGPEAEGCQNAGLCKAGEYEDKDGLKVHDERWQQKMSVATLLPFCYHCRMSDTKKPPKEAA